MIPRAFVRAWRQHAPWVEDDQVEQDLVLTRVLVEIFSHETISPQITLRGGTALNKIYVAPPLRFSEDIDLVQREPGPIGPIINPMQSLLEPVLGDADVELSARSATLRYKFEGSFEPSKTLRLKIEINTREQFSIMGYSTKRLEIENPWFTGTTDVTTYRLPELMGTKMRALYQRKKGRDLFDLWLVLENEMVRPEEVVECCRAYLDREGNPVTRAQFERNLHHKRTDREFTADIGPLLTDGVDYDQSKAFEFVLNELVARLPGEPWASADSPSV